MGQNETSSKFPRPKERLGLDRTARGLGDAKTPMVVRSRRVGTRHGEHCEGISRRTARVRESEEAGSRGFEPRGREDPGRDRGKALRQGDLSPGYRPGPRRVEGFLPSSASGLGASNQELPPDPQALTQSPKRSRSPSIHSGTQGTKIKTSPTLRRSALARLKRSSRWEGEDLRPMMIREVEDLPPIHVVFPGPMLTPGSQCDHKTNPVPLGSGEYCPVCHQSGWDHYLFGKLVSELERQARQEPPQEEIVFSPRVA